MKHTAIVMSAGVGSRIGGNIPKQYMDLNGIPVICHSLKALQESFMDEIIIVAGRTDVDFVRNEIVSEYGFSKVVSVVPGGAERSDSVYEGLKAVKDPDDTFVYIHDGARPMLNETILENVRTGVERYGASIAAVKSKDTVKIVDDEGVVTLTPKRSGVYNVQTPQAFNCAELMRAYDAFRSDTGAEATDDAMVMELYGKRKVHVAEGDYRNIKITTKEDFLTAEKFLNIF